VTVRVRYLMTLALMIATGCGSSTTSSGGGDGSGGGETGVGGNPPATCPPHAPMPDTPCGAVMTCTYPEACDDETVAECDGMTWIVTWPILLGCDDPTCPSAKPSSGEICGTLANGLVCDFPAEPPCEDQTATASCVDGAWEVQEPMCAM